MEIRESEATMTYLATFVETVRENVKGDPDVEYWHSGGGIMVLNVDLFVSADVCARFGFGPGVPESAEEARENLAGYCLIWDVVGPDGAPIDENGEGETLVGYLDDLAPDRGVGLDDEFFAAESFGRFVAGLINENSHHFGPAMEAAQEAAQKIEER